MGFDISNHAVDVDAIKRRIIPFVRGRDVAIDDLVSRAARLNCIKFRANTWGLGLVDESQTLWDRQYSLGIVRKVRWRERQGLFARLFRRPPTYRDGEVPQVTGIPGFDTDLSVWGRPFFIAADSTDEALDAFDAYMALPDASPEAVDALAKSMLAKLDARRGEPLEDFDVRVLKVLDDTYPLLGRVQPKADTDPPDEAVTAQWLRREFDRARFVFDKRDTDEVLQGDDEDEPVPVRDLAPTLAYRVFNLAAQNLPGWMGRGRVWPTCLFQTIGVSVSHVFERPTSLFEDLLRDVPEMEDTLRTSITENFCLGGYVPPPKMQSFVDLLVKHRRDLVLAWHERQREPTELEIEEVSSDFKKILEPATYAARHGYGFIEAAEVYSGILGWMN